jgi:hypothetical protein
LVSGLRSPFEAVIDVVVGSAVDIWQDHGGVIGTVRHRLASPVPRAGSADELALEPSQPESRLVHSRVERDGRATTDSYCPDDVAAPFDHHLTSDGFAEMADGGVGERHDCSLHAHEVAAKAFGLPRS